MSPSHTVKHFNASHEELDFGGPIKFLFPGPGVCSMPVTTYVEFDIKKYKTKYNYLFSSSSLMQVYWSSLFTHSFLDVS